MCFYCKNEKTKNSITTYMVDLKDCIIIIKNIPCEECTQCDEKYISDEVMERIEKIIRQVRSIAGEVFVTDYAKKIA